MFSTCCVIMYLLAVLSVRFGQTFHALLAAGARNFFLILAEPHFVDPEIRQPFDPALLATLLVIFATVPFFPGNELRRLLQLRSVP
jgi:hypothetical protein